jgi:uncharacterized protein YcbK (DUF882 family)
MRVRGTARDADTIDLPTRRVALKAGLGLMAAAAMPAPAWARALHGAHSGHGGHAAHGTHGAHATHAAVGAHTARSAHATHAAHPAAHSDYVAHALIKKPSRELSFLNLHTGERLRAEYVHNGQVVPSAMHAISVVMRDHYNNQVHPIDPQLLDIAHVLQSHVGNRGNIELVCGYRSPETNAWMHEASAGVAAHSMHVEGRAMDIRMPGIRLGSLRRTAIALNAGGVGYYPHDDFVHIDSGPVRKWAG